MSFLVLCYNIFMKERQKEKGGGACQAKMEGNETVFGSSKMCSFQNSSRVFHIISRSCKFENRNSVEKINRYSLISQELHSTSVFTVFLKLSLICNSRIDITPFHQICSPTSQIRRKKDYRQVNSLSVFRFQNYLSELFTEDSMTREAISFYLSFC